MRRGATRKNGIRMKIRRVPRAGIPSRFLRREFFVIVKRCFKRWLIFPRDDFDCKIHRRDIPYDRKMRRETISVDFLRLKFVNKSGSLRVLTRKNLGIFLNDLISTRYLLNTFCVCVCVTNWGTVCIPVSRRRRAEDILGKASTYKRSRGERWRESDVCKKDGRDSHTRYYIC